MGILGGSSPPAGLGAASQRGALGARGARMPRPGAGSREPKEGGGDQLEQKSRVGAGAAVGGPETGMATCPLPPPLKGHPGPLSTPLCKAASLPPPARPPQWDQSRSEVRGLGLGPLPALLASLGLPTSTLHGGLVAHPFPRLCTAECECLGIVKVHQVLPARRQHPCRPPEQAAPLPPPQDMCNGGGGLFLA